MSENRTEFPYKCMGCNTPLRWGFLCDECKEKMHSMWNNIEQAYF